MSAVQTEVQTTTTLLATGGLDVPTSGLNSGRHSRKSTNAPFDDEREELINQAMGLQDALSALMNRAEGAKMQHLQQAAENQVLLKYINNLMSASGANNAK
ncbi:hypothetical protein BJ742DRAFT_819139 [Cladochytrium replicatum]|nr:hypothetical protein BJ742DRAFT_819139 [Cladochytrium replicatum]